VFRLDTKQSAASDDRSARLTCAFLRQDPEAARRTATNAAPWGAPLALEDPTLDTVAWRLLQQTSAVLGLALTRRDTAERCELRITFPTSATPLAAAPLPPGLRADDIGLQAPFTHTLVGRHIVVLSAQRELRNIVRDALRPTGSMIDFVTSLDEAQRLFEDALPHAVVYEASLGGPRLDRLRRTLLLDAPTLVFVRVSPDGNAFEVMEADGHRHASVGLGGLVETLPAALLSELSRHR
jgi:hypothetical protein